MYVCYLIKKDASMTLAPFIQALGTNIANDIYSINSSNNHNLSR